VDFVLLTGLALGAAHVFAGPDHLAAVAPLARAGGVRGAWIGARWGLGHSGGVALVALAARWMLESAQVEALSSWSERFVGVALIALGLWGFYRSMRRALPEHAASERVHAHAAFGFGALHGLAGASHLLGVVPALAQPSRTDTLLYLAGFTLGTIAAMAAFSAAIAWTAAHSSERWRARLGHASCAAAVLVGAWWLA
jgi:sulfite exporter TauE/SafE